MHPRAYTTLAATEDNGWYYQARARCLVRLVERFVAADKQPLEILDVGCGTGGTSSVLCRFGRVTGLEPSSIAIELLRQRAAPVRVVQGAVDDAATLLDADAFDLATIMGVLYHQNVVDPGHALQQVARTLKPGGWLVWNEAVYSILRREHDDFVETGRRFTPRQMKALLEQAGFSVHFSSHLLAWGFPVGMALGVLHRIRRRVAGSRAYDEHVSDDRPLPPLLNATLRELTFLEWACALRHIKAPFGVSYLILARKSAC